MPRAGPLQVDYITYDHDRDVRRRASREEAARYAAITGGNREGSRRGSEGREQGIQQPVNVGGPEKPRITPEGQPPIVGARYVISNFKGF